MAEKQKGSSSTSKKQQAVSEEGRFSISTIRRKLREYQRILTLTRRPTREEFSTIAKVAAIGIIIIGAAGFVIYLAMVQAPNSLGITNATHTQSTAPASTVPPEANNTMSSSSTTLTNSTQEAASRVIT